MAFCNEMLGSILDSGQRRWRTRRSRTSAWLTCPLPKAEGFFSGGWILVSQRLLEYNAWASIGSSGLDFLVLLSIFFFLAKIFLPVPWISDSRRLSPRIHNASTSWKKGPFLYTIWKVKFWSKNSILTKPQHFHEFFTQIFLPMFLVKSKLSTAKKSKTTTFSRVFHPKKIDNFLGKSILNFWTKN